MKKIVLLTCVLLFLFNSAAAQSSAPEKEDNQFWHETIIGFPLLKKLTLTINGVIRYSGQTGHLADKRAGFGLAYKFSKNLTAGANYFYRKSEFTRNRKNYESRYLGYLTLSKALGKYNLSERNQFEYQSRYSRSDKWVYRNRLQLDRNISLNGFKIKPFASAEVFYDSQLETFHRLRMIIGVSKKFNKSVTIDAFYLRQQDGMSRPGDLNVFGTTLRLDFESLPFN